VTGPGQLLLEPQGLVCAGSDRHRSAFFAVKCVYPRISINKRRTAPAQEEVASAAPSGGDPSSQPAGNESAAGLAVAVLGPARVAELAHVMSVAAAIRRDVAELDVSTVAATRQAVRKLPLCWMSPRPGHAAVTWPRAQPVRESNKCVLSKVDRS
jgi:hypothetical protein